MNILIYFYSFNPTGELLATGSNDKSLRLMAFNAEACKIGAVNHSTLKLENTTVVLSSHNLGRCTNSNYIISDMHHTLIFIGRLLFSSSLPRSLPAGALLNTAKIRWRSSIKTLAHDIAAEVLKEFRKCYRVLTEFNSTPRPTKPYYPLGVGKLVVTSVAKGKDLESIGQ